MGIFEPSWGVSGRFSASYRRLETVLGRPGAVLGHLRLGPSWGRLGTSWDDFGAVLRASWWRLGAILCRLQGLLARLGGVLGTLGGQDPTRARAIRVLRPLKTRFGLIFGRFLDVFWDHFSITFLSYPERTQHVIKPKKYYFLYYRRAF